MDKRVGSCRKHAVNWLSNYEPDQMVMVKHHSQLVPAKLIRQRHQPQGTWLAQKQLGKVWTKESVVVESEFSIHLSRKEHTMAAPKSTKSRVSQLNLVNKQMFDKMRTDTEGFNSQKLIISDGSAFYLESHYLKQGIDSPLAFGTGQFYFGENLRELVFVDQQVIYSYGTTDNLDSATLHEDIVDEVDRVLNSTPVGIIVSCSKKSKAALKSKHIVLVNADEDTGYDIAYLGRSGFPMMSFKCLAQMLAAHENYVASHFTAGDLVLQDFQAETRIPIEKKIADKIHKVYGSFPKGNCGLKPPKRGYSVVHENGKKYSWHRTGAILLKSTSSKVCYIFGQDEGTYFGCELPKMCSTLDQAYEMLMPPEARECDDWKRQGEWFAIPVEELKVPPISDCLLFGGGNYSNSCNDITGFCLPVLTEDDNLHEIEDTDEVRISKDGRIYVKNVRLTHPEHADLQVSGWSVFCRNTAVRSVSQEGVD